MSPILISCKNLKKTFNKGTLDQIVLNNLNLNIEKGEFVSIIGTSGSGKSTLVHILGLLDANFSGEYLFDSKCVKAMSDDELSQHRNSSVGFVFQQYNLIDSYNVTENIQLPFLYSLSKLDLDKMYQLAKQLNMIDKLNDFPSNLSGGQKQRVAIIRALMINPKIIIADEPTGSLDVQSTNEILNIFKKLNQEGITIILVTHDPEVAKYSSRILEMRNGKLIEN
ncbi:ABC transporter ATP-binding protein [Staphylococcus agnetis]|uniref:ABC transporter ATP-binding protein n=1 Tax=Staphylococcus agnetis TaxID=985762 RepID=UPI000E05DAB4|nr:ABC transporter ATP-binding protein [Staphylococcus agnetis]SUK16665.1 ABC transporter ATP-binding protein [Staphylococcus agnetis]